MSEKKNIKVIKEDKNGRNIYFQHCGRQMTRLQMVKEIKDGKHPGYHIRKINGKDTPVSNPDRKKGNNLG